MNWRAADKVAAWKVFKLRMEVIFVADQIPEERQWALILVAGGDEAYNRWDTLEDTVKDRKVVQQVWDAFEKSFKQSTSFWHFRDAYLADFRQDELETTADLDLRIKQTVRGCQWKKESEEERMIDLLYHATIYYEICKFVQESDPAALTYEMVIEKAKAHERNVLEYKDHQASHGGANSAPSYNNPLLSAHAVAISVRIDIFPRIELFPLSSGQVIILIARMTFNSFLSCLMSKVSIEITINTSKWHERAKQWNGNSQISSHS